jgi:hypothetical protein
MMRNHGIESALLMRKADYGCRLWLGFEVSGGEWACLCDPLCGGEDGRAVDCQFSTFVLFVEDRGSRSALPSMNYC